MALQLSQNLQVYYLVCSSKENTARLYIYIYIIYIEILHLLSNISGPNRFDPPWRLIKNYTPCHKCRGEYAPVANLDLNGPKNEQTSPASRSILFPCRAACFTCFTATCCNANQVDCVEGGSNKIPPGPDGDLLKKLYENKQSWGPWSKR